MPYVVYLTLYRGNLLPPFYIGYTTETKILKGYNGTVQSQKYKAIWRQERVNHPHLFNTVILSHHATDSEAILREESLQRFFDAPNNPMYINMAIANKGFGGSGMNHPRFGAHLTEETLKKLRVPKSEEARKRNSLSHKGQVGWMKGKHHKEESIQKLRFPKPQVTCPHCNKTGGSNIMGRWHFDNCKLRIDA